MNVQYKDYEQVAKEIYEVRRKWDRNDHRRPFEIHAEVAKIMIRDLQGRGSFYNDGRNTYFFHDAEKKLVEIHPDDIEYRLLLARYGINATETMFKYLVEALRVEALTNGMQTEVYRLAHYNSKAGTLYFFNYNDQIYRITCENIDLVPNGTDGVLFKADGKTEPFTIAQHQPSSSSNWLEKVIITRMNFADGLLTRGEQGFLFLLWFFSMFFQEIMPTKVILALLGEKGSGKTISIRKIGLLLFGKQFNVMPLSKDSKDFDAAVTNSAFVAIDNADTKCSWLDDRLAVVATGASIKRRAYYTTNKLVDFPTCCYLALTSRTPHFRRDDVADRLLILKVERFDEFISEATLLAEVAEHRDVILTEVVGKLQECVRALKGEQEKNYTSEFRMADFYSLAMKVSPCFGIGKKKVRSVFFKLSRLQSSFNLEEDPIVLLLLAWAEDNQDREVTNKELWEELKKLAEREKMDFPYKDSFRSFAQRMTQIRRNLSEFFTISERSIGGNRKVYKYRPKWRDEEN